MLNEYKDVLLNMTLGDSCRTMEKYKDIFLAEVSHITEFDRSVGIEGYFYALKIRC